MSKQASFTLTKDHAADIMSSRAAMMEAMRDACTTWASHILAELSYIGDNVSPLDRARHAAVFSVMSPQCIFERNCMVTPPLVRAIMRGATRDELKDIIVLHGIGLQNSKADALHAASEWLRTLTPETLTRELCCNVRGIALKASAMTLALYDPRSRVYTLDVHMLRGLFSLIGMDPAGKLTVGDPTYKRLESWLIDIHEELFGDTLPIFVSQWALWNTWKLQQHEIHLPIFGL